MAVQQGPVFLESVTIDGIIYYKWRGVYLMRKAPGQGGVRQTKATKRSAASFGVASEVAKLLYRSFGSIIPTYLNNMTMHNRVRAVMRSVVGKEDSSENAAYWNYDYLEHFSFNNQAIFPPQIRNENICRMSRKNSVTVSFPALNLKKIAAPKNTCFINFRLMAGVFDFRRNKLKDCVILEIEHIYNEITIPEQDFKLRFTKRTQVGNVVIVALQISFFTGKHKIISAIKYQEYEVSGIIGVFRVG